MIPGFYSNNDPYKYSVGGTPYLSGYDSLIGQNYGFGKQAEAANIGTIRPLSRAECASFVADKEYSIAAHTSGSSPDNPVVQALLGNSVSGLYDLWNAPSLKSLIVGGVNPGIPWLPSWSGGLSGIATDKLIKAAMINSTKGSD